MIPFNVAPYFQSGMDYIKQVVESRKTCGDGYFTGKCSQWMEKRFGARKVLLTTSGTDALELAALLCNIQKDDEVILPSYTFSSTANAFALRGAKLVFVDIRPDTMNIDESKIESAITEKTKVICCVHYAGVSCEMDTILKIARLHNLLVVEDAAQGVMSEYKGKALGTIGDLGCYSFHETKNYSMGEGGALLINNSAFIERAEILREKGTDRSKFLRGQIDKYTWVDFGSSFLPSEINAAYLYAQLENADLINRDRLNSWQQYFKAFRDLAGEAFDLPFVPDDCKHNAHMFYLKCKDLEDRTRFISYMRENGAVCSFHYVPLHSAPAGSIFGRFHGEDKYTTKESERLVRLPMYYGLSEDDRIRVVHAAAEYFMKQS